MWFGNLLEKDPCDLNTTFSETFIVSKYGARSICSFSKPEQTVLDKFDLVRWKKAKLVPVLDHFNEWSCMTGRKGAHVHY